jgi:membrane protein
MLIAAGSTFYLLLALFPALTAFVSVYGFLADRAAVAGNTSLLVGALVRR